MNETNRKIEHYLLIHDYAIPAWMCWMTLTCAALVYTLASGPLVGEVPWSEAAIVPSVMLVWSVVWLLAGASAGWLPRRI